MLSLIEGVLCSAKKNFFWRNTSLLIISSMLAVACPWVHQAPQKFLLLLFCKPCTVLASCHVTLFPLVLQTSVMSCYHMRACIESYHLPTCTPCGRRATCMHPQMSAANACFDNDHLALYALAVDGASTFSSELSQRLPRV